MLVPSVADDELRFFFDVCAGDLVISSAYIHFGVDLRSSPTQGTRDVFAYYFVSLFGLCLDLPCQNCTMKNLKMSGGSSSKVVQTHDHHITAVCC